jgi:hypothetical protein
MTIPPLTKNELHTCATRFDFNKIMIFCHGKLHTL